MNCFSKVSNNLSDSSPGLGLQFPQEFQVDLSEGNQ